MKPITVEAVQYCEIMQFISDVEYIYRQAIPVEFLFWAGPPTDRMTNATVIHAKD